MELRRLTPDFAVSEQIVEEDLAHLAAAGFRAVINNRPDGEAPGQPTAAALASAAEERGLAYRHLPVRSGAVTAADVEALSAALTAVPGPVLAFCRSGTRSTVLWALAEAPRLGADDVLRRAAAAGYELAPLRPQLEARAASGARAAGPARVGT